MAMDLTAGPATGPAERRPEEQRPEEQRPEEKRLVWRCRRGMRELDVLLGRYLVQEYPTQPAPERAAFARLLEEEDPTLHRWLVGRVEPEDAGLRPLIARIRALAAAPPPGPVPGPVPGLGQAPDPGTSPP